MFFTKYIKPNATYNNIATLLITWLMKMLKLTRPIFKNVGNNVIIISLHKLGDSVFTISAIKKILKFHQNNIFLICYDECLPIYKLSLKSINLVGVSHSDFIFRIAKIKVRKLCKNLNASVIYDLTGNITSLSLFFNTAAQEIIGINEPYYRTMYSKYVPIRTVPHITDIYLDAIRPKILEFDVEENQIVRTQHKGYILIHPFAGYISKEWGISKFITLSDFLNKRFNCQIISPRNRISEDIKKEIQMKNVRLIETKTTDDLITEIKNCSLFIGNDSGPIHIANILGKPTFTIYGPTNPDFHRPLEGINDFIIKNMKCSPQKDSKLCYTFGGVFCPSYECMYNLTFDEVKNRLLSYIEFLKEENSMPEMDNKNQSG